MLSAAYFLLGGLLCSLQLNTGSFPLPLTEEEEKYWQDRLATYAARCVETATLSPEKQCAGGQTRFSSKIRPGR